MNRTARLLGEVLQGLLLGILLSVALPPMRGAASGGAAFRYQMF